MEKDEKQGSNPAKTCCGVLGRDHAGSSWAREQLVKYSGVMPAGC